MPQHQKWSSQPWLPFAILALPALAFSLLLPYFPIDETRYLSVGWEMWNQGSFIVPLQNGLPYSHKPPLLFWLFNLDWLIFGVNEATLRFIPLIFSLMNVVLVHRMAKRLWQDEQVARYAALVLASMLSYLLWSTVIMFDVVLTLWVLLAVDAMISAVKEPRFLWFSQFGVAIGIGILTKGPVVLVYVLPVALFAPFWAPGDRPALRWYAYIGLSLVIGIGVLSLWLVPAALNGGDTYRRAILWGQTVNRMAHSFAHRRPFWWYLPWIPTLLLPWVLFPPAWRAWKGLTGDPGSRMVMIWCGVSLMVFSLLSGKQVHYLIPILPAFSLLMAKSIAQEQGDVARWRLPMAVLYLLLGAGLLTASFINHGRMLRFFDLNEVRWAAGGLALVGVLLLCLRPRNMPALVTRVAAASLACCALVLLGGQTMFQRYDMHPIAQAIKQKQAEGYEVLHAGKYHGQFHFMGRLTHPLVELRSPEEVGAYVATHEKVALVTYEPDRRRIDPREYFFMQPFRNRQAVLWNRDGIARYVREAAPGQTPAAGDE
ncbi:ArnT family glycosyltransferase [Geomonas edaphica]|uniref:ArnT family glycosyltransferase n=1 Tax=Geomonas edaphica TaxID=2570226 RepID=UPI0010A85A39|nr:glycosyltransferase family 39 protein [Geomonas edaphica]